MTKPSTELPAAKRPMLTTYAILWSMLGMLGLGYLGVAIFAPDVLEELTPPSRQAERLRAETEATMLRVSADIGGLKTNLSQVQGDVARVRDEAGVNAAQNKALEGRIATLEDQMRQIQGEAAPAPAKPATPAKVSQLEGTDDIPPPETKAASKGSIPPEGGAGERQLAAETGPKAPKIINSKDKGGTIETGSVNANKPQATGENVEDGKTAKDSAISFGPAVVKPAAKPVGIRVASGSSVDGLRLSWSLLSENHDALKALKPRYVDSGDALNPSYDLVAGPVKTKADAVKLCKKLNAKNVPCTVGDFKGEDL